MCTQHCVMASHEIITSVFDVIVVVVAVVVLQLHTIQFKQREWMNESKSKRKRRWRTTEENETVLWFWCLIQNYSNSFQYKGRLKNSVVVKQRRCHVFFSNIFLPAKSQSSYVQQISNRNYISMDSWQFPNNVDKHLNLLYALHIFALQTTRSTRHQSKIQFDIRKRFVCQKEMKERNQKLKWNRICHVMKAQRPKGLESINNE